MAVQGQFAVTSKIAAGEDLRTHQYKAIAFDDGERADDSHEAAGIILTAGNRLRVTTDGWLVLADSGYYTVGRARTTVTSGSIGTGFFNFAAPFYQDVSSL